jgi:hypothetical protein
MKGAGLLLACRFGPAWPLWLRVPAQARWLKNQPPRPVPCPRVPGTISPSGGRGQVTAGRWAVRLAAPLDVVAFAWDCADQPAFA